jgi:hypothetical protein
MAKRNLKVVKRIRNIPVLGICELCDAQFHVEPRPHGQPSESQSAMQQQFNAHICKTEAEGKDSAQDRN